MNDIAMQAVFSLRCRRWCLKSAVQSQETSFARVVAGTWSVEEQTRAPAALIFVVASAVEAFKSTSRSRESMWQGRVCARNIVTLNRQMNGLMILSRHSHNRPCFSYFARNPTEATRRYSVSTDGMYKPRKQTKGGVEQNMRRSTALSFTTATHDESQQNKQQRRINVYDESENWEDWFSREEYVDPWGKVLEPLDYQPLDDDTRRVIQQLQDAYHGAAVDWQASPITTEQCNRVS